MSEARRTFLMIVLAVLCARIGWSGEPLCLPFAMLFPMLWGHARSRTAASLMAAGYFMAASRGLPLGVAAYFASELWFGAGLWFGAALGFVLVHGMLWARAAGPRPAWRYGVCLILMSVPPFGILGWASPLTAAGILFPAWGWAGLATSFALLCMMAMPRWRYGAAIILVAWGTALLNWREPSVPAGWQGLDLAYGQSLGRDLSQAHRLALAATIKQQVRKEARTILLPENAFGFWTETSSAFWMDELNGTVMTFIGGASIITPDGYDNVLVEVREQCSQILYRQRMPVPVAMWQPWRAWFGEIGGASASFFRDPIVIHDGKRIAPLICYEQLLIWPVLHALVLRPDMIIASANGWWAADTSIIAIQRASVIAWARLFDLPLVTSFNL